MASCTYTAVSSLLLVVVLLQGCAAQVREAAPSQGGRPLGPPAGQKQCYQHTEPLPYTLTTVCVGGLASRVEATGDVRNLGRTYAATGNGQMTWTGGDPCDSDPAAKYSVTATVLCGDGSEGGYVARAGCNYDMTVYSPAACAKAASPVVPSPVLPSPVLPSPVVGPSPVLPSPAVVPSPVVAAPRRSAPRPPVVKVPEPEPVAPIAAPITPNTTDPVVPVAPITATPPATPASSTADGQAVGAVVPRGVEPVGAAVPRAVKPEEKKEKRKLTKDGAVLAGIIIGPALIFGTMLCWGMLFAWRWYKDREMQQEQALGDPYSTIDNPIAGTKADPSAVATPPPAPRLPSSSHWV